jgi:hypothetical protein
MIPTLKLTAYYGKAIRATVDGRDMAAMVGIDPDRVGHDAQKRAEAEPCEEQHCPEHAERHEVAVGEVDDPGDAEDQGEPAAEEPVQPAHQNAADQRLHECRHHGITLRRWTEDRKPGRTFSQYERLNAL